MAYLAREPNGDSSRMRPKPHMSFLIVALTIVLSACSTSSAVDQKRLDALTADTMADYQPPTGELMSSGEQTGSRYYVSGGDWEEGSSYVMRRWSTTASRAEIVGDVVAALEENGWTEITESEVGTTSVDIGAIKPHDGYCAVASVSVSDIGGGRVALYLQAPYSGSERTGCPDE